MTNIPATEGNQPSTFSPLHAEALAVMYNQQAKKETLARNGFWKQIQKDLKVLNENTFNEEVDRLNAADLVKGLNMLFTQLDPKMELRIALGHGDFTPWNMYVSSTGLDVFDWDTGKKGYPLLFDLFHFSFQSGVVLHQEKASVIQERIQASLEMKPMATLVQKFNLSPVFYQKLYLLQTVSNYLVQCIQHPALENPSESLVRTWTESVSLLLEQKN